VAQARIKSSFIYLANAVNDLTGNWQVIALVLAPVALLASLCLLPDALNLQHLVSEAFKQGAQGQNVSFLPAQTPYVAAPHIEPLIPRWATRSLRLVFLMLTAVTIVVVLCMLKWIQEGRRGSNVLDSTFQIYRHAMTHLLPFLWLYLLQLFAVLPLFLWANLMLPLIVAVLVVLLIVPGFLAFVWLSVAQYALVFDGYRTWLALFYGRELIRGRFLKVTLRIIVFLAVWSGYNTWAGGLFLALSTILLAWGLGLAGAFAGALWVGVFLVDLLAVSVVFATTAFFFAAGLRLYQDLKASAPPAAAAMVQGPMSATGPLQSAAM
jgi:hypothetical protein